ncbi:MAG: hypothetical protein ABL889_01735 [Terricaulis sp.]
MTASVASAAKANLAQVGARILARVHDSNHATDLAIALSPARLAVVRCVERAAPEDHTALATMLTGGDFVWAGLVYGEREGSETVGLVETFHVSELDRLVSRLLELREVFGEAG